MKVRLAKTAGFCMGVRRAMELVLTEANKGDEPLYTFGPLIHNRQVLDLLETKGIKGIDDPMTITRGRVVIRAHGIPPGDRKAMKDKGLKIIDATCPRVARVQALIKFYSGRGMNTVIVGDREHPEVKGLMGFSATRSYIIQKPEEAESIPAAEPLFVVAQTTQDERKYRDVVNVLKGRCENVLVFDTICDATVNRQQEVRTLAQQVDAVVVVGGFNSGNTRRLVQISRESGKPAFHVETEEDIDRERLSEMGIVGISAGASTPNWMLNSVIKEVEDIRGRMGDTISSALRRAFKTLVLGNIILALGAFSFSWAAFIVMFARPDPAFPTVAFLYIYSMHILNRFLDKGASAYNDPERASFLKKHKLALIVSGILAIMGSLATALWIGFHAFLVLCVLSLVGIIYSIPLVPGAFRHRYRYAKIKDVPGSKSLSEALAWTAVIVVLPLLEMEYVAWRAALITMAIVLLTSYTRSVLFEIFQVQGDLISGTETLPIALGEKRAVKLLRMILAGAVLVMGFALAAGWIEPEGVVLVIPLLGLALTLETYERRRLHTGPVLEGLVEGTFILSGLTAFLWRVLWLTG